MVDATEFPGAFAAPVQVVIREHRTRIAEGTNP